MQLTAEQETTVRAWAEEGLDLGEIQRRLAEEFGVTITYMETRFLVSDLEVSIKDKERDDSAAKLDGSATPDEDDFGEPLEEDDGLPGGGVQVSLDQLAKPNTLVSGSVRFSDGKTAEWYIDVNQQLGMIPPSPDYKPSNDDLMAFQQELRSVLQRGY